MKTRDFYCWTMFGIAGGKCERCITVLAVCEGISTVCCHCNTSRTISGGSQQIKQEMQRILPQPSRRQAKLLVSRRHAFFTKICVSPAGRVCVYSSLILSTFFSSFFQLQYSCIFHWKAVLDCCVRCSNEVDIQS